LLLDLVIPAHNEGHRIDRTLSAYRSLWPEPDTRFLVALDGCTDATAEIVRRHTSDPRVEAIEFPRLGKGGVLMEAFRHTGAELVGFVDADCATPPAEMARLVEAAGDADGAIASRHHTASVVPARHPTRELLSSGFAFAMRKLFNLPYADTQCGAKVFRREVVADAIPLLSSRDFLFDVDLLVTARKLGYRIVELPTVWIDREGSRLSPVSDSKRMAASALRLWFHHRVIPVDRRSGAHGGRARPPRRRRPEPERSIHLGTGSRPDVAMVSPYPSAGNGNGNGNGNGEGAPAEGGDAALSGVAPYASRLVHALTEAGAEVTVIAPEEPGEPVRRREGRVRLERRFRRGTRALPEAVHAAKATGAPVTHLQHELFLYGGPESVPALIPALGGFRNGQRMVVTMHHVVEPSAVDREFIRMHRLRAPVGLTRAALASVQRAIPRLAEAVIVHEPAFAPTVPGARVVPHGLEAGAATPGREEARGRLGLGPGLVALCFGFLAPYKGLETALEAAALAGDRVQLVVAGGEHPRLAGRDSYAEELRARYGRIARFTGWLPEESVPWWFAAADLALFMYPRPHASSGGLALSLSHGTPPLLSPALAHATEAPRALEAPPDPRGLARLLSALASEPGLPAPMHAATEQLTRSRSWSEVAARHLQIYEEVTSGNGAADGQLR
jgi:glycosyltransferase involved in cell wall biosynthesis